MTVGLVVAASVAFGCGGAFMKSADGLSRPWPSAAVVASFLVGAVLLARAVRTEGLAVAYTMGLGVEAVVTLVLARYVFGEHLSVNQLAGIGFIIAGVAGVRWG